MLNILTFWASDVESHDIIHSKPDVYVSMLVTHAATYKNPAYAPVDLAVLK